MIIKKLDNEMRNKLFFTMILILIYNTAYSYSCNNGKSVKYVTKFHIQKDDGSDMNNAFIYYYPMVNLHNEGYSFDRTDSDGMGNACVEVCVPYNHAIPKSIDCKIVIKDNFDGEEYEIVNMKVKLFPDAGYDTIVHPVILHKKGMINSVSSNNQRRHGHKKPHHRQSNRNEIEYDCPSGETLHIGILPDGSWNFSTLSGNILGGGGGRRAAFAAAEDYCQ